MSDDAPLTDELLRAVGFAREMQAAADHHQTFRLGAANVTRWKGHRDAGPRWSVRRHADEMPEWVPACIAPTTLGGLRALFGLLGVVMPEPR
jgi:hypothetical protein